MRRADRRPATPRFGRRRRWGRVLAPLAFVVVAAGVTAALVLPPDSDTVDADVLASEGPTPDATAPSTDVATSPTPGDASPTPTPRTSEASEQATAQAASVTGPPLVEAGRQLPEVRSDLTPPLERLQRRIDAVVASMAPSLEGAEVSVAVRDDEGRRVYDRGEGQRLLPASTMKSVTAATVLSTLGPTHRFTTTVAAAGEVVDGVVEGDLVIRGGGDPALTTDDYRTHVYPSRPATSIEDLADAVVSQGITTVTGRVVADGSGWSNADVAAGWRRSYLDDQNARHITRLTVDAGLTVDVDIPADEPVQVELHAARDPVQTTASVFAARLAERGVSVRGGTATTRLPMATSDPLAAVQSPPVSELLAFTMQRSDNHLADTLLLAASYAATGDGSWAAANRTVPAVLDALGIPSAGVQVADGSGLSRLDRVSAAQLADLDVAMMAGPNASVWADSLAVAGQTGTLRGRLRGTPADGRFLGKTGTLDDVKAVAGHVRPGAGDAPRLHLAVIANGVPAGGQWAISVLMDRLALELADHQDGCITVYPTEGDDGNTEAAPVRSCD